MPGADVMCSWSALRELERDFPRAGIIVATRTHHLVPPLPGAARLRLLRLRRDQRAAYIATRLEGRAAELNARIDADPALDELTRTPFVLAEVASLVEANFPIPSTKVEVIARVLAVHEARQEHRNALQTAPILSRQSEYLQTLAVEMTRRGSVALTDADARAKIAAVVRRLQAEGQVEQAAAPLVLANLTAHHVLERVDYPRLEFQFEHQQLQEYYAALELRARLLRLRAEEPDAVTRFIEDYVNKPAWAEPLRMVAETFSERFAREEPRETSIAAGSALIEMALIVDPVFAGELARLCGTAVWNEVRTTVGGRLRTIYTARDAAYREYAVAAMLATGAPDFADIVGPLLSSEDQQVRLETYRLWPGFHVTSLGENWPFVVRGWIESAREDFVAELLQHRADADVVELAARDDSERVKKAAASGLIWTGSEDALVSLVDTMSSRTFDEFVVNWQGELPRALRPRAIAAMRNQLSEAKDPAACLRMARSLIELGEAGLADTIKDALLAIPDADIHRMSEHYIRPALTYLGGVDAAWTSSWVADQLSRGTLFNHEYWLPLAPAIPPEFAAACLDRLETEDLDGHGVEGICAIIARDADAAVAGQIFVSIRNLQQVIDRAVAVQPVLETSLKRQLENAFRMLPGDVAVEGVLASVQAGNPDDLRVATNLLSRVARLDRTPLHIASADLSGRLRAYLKSSVSVVLAHDDFRGEEKAHLASAIAQVGEPEDVADLVTLIRADINRMRIGRAARARGERNGAAEGAPHQVQTKRTGSLHATYRQAVDRRRQPS